MAWLPLADHDPVPGDHFATAELGVYFSYEATKLRNIVAELNRLDAGMWEGDAAERFRDRRADLTPRLEAIAKRWDGASLAIKVWAQEMDDAQTLARRARDDAQFAEQQRFTAQARLDSARGVFRPDLLSALTDQPVPPADAMIPWLEGEVADREADIAASRALLHQATELYETGARKCEGALDTASDDTLENHHGVFSGIRRKIHGAVKRFPQIKTAAKWIGLAAGALAIAASMFTPVGWVATLAFVVGGLATTLDMALAVSGDGKWSTVAWDAFGLLTFGLGRAFASAARGTGAVRGIESTRRAATAASVKGIVAEGVNEARSGLGAAAQSPMAELVEKWRVFAPEAAEGLLPEGRNWLRAVTFWQEIKIPPPQLLQVSDSATRYATTSRVFEGLNRLNDLRGVVASEKEVFESGSE